MARPRPPMRPLLPLSPHSIERICCSICGRVWAVYEGKMPRMWTVLGEKVFCDRRPCNAALDELRTAKAG